jgi:hypothetical protein
MSQALSEEEKYWKILWSNVKLSAKHGAGGARISKLRGHGERDLSITLEDIKILWEKQKGLCYWLNIEMSLSDLIIKDSPFAPSAERLDNNVGYVPGNVVLASRFANRGRGAYNGEDFASRLRKLLKEGAKHMPQPIDTSPPWWDGTISINFTPDEWRGIADELRMLYYIPEFPENEYDHMMINIIDRIEKSLGEE